MKVQKILVVGSINQDIIYHDLIDPGMNENGMAYKGYITANGGKGANQAAACAKLGADVYLAGCVGDDATGQDQLNGLSQLGVHTQFIKVTPDFQTGMSVMLNRLDGSYIGANVPGANRTLTPALVENILSVHSFDMILMQLEMPLETVYRTYEIAASKEIPVILDAGPARKIPLDRLNGIFMITPNEEEAYAMTDIRITDEKSAQVAARNLISQSGAKYIVLKLGSKGAYVYDGKIGTMHHPFKTVSVDSTAAGDSFTAELAICLCSGMSMTESVRHANAAGAICVSRYGGQPSVPSKEELELFLSNNKSHGGTL